VLREGDGGEGSYSYLNASTTFIRAAWRFLSGSEVFGDICHVVNVIDVTVFFFFAF